ncbi:keratin, type II cytoskeletal 2 epidermal-like [Eupeodes corollae]|uniref:keratin, type II cytoskeletal 2 epidermal-like n=1 Tax=Eupeodes corollae TaxID=290404 RepID=UPI002491DFEC|nr:keratin, type II cytoskeletal 2 epidermal-like [Eupeodes corollae]
MRGFLVLCFIAAASAQGYNYAPISGGSVGGGGHSHHHVGGIGGGFSSGGLSSGGSFSSGGGSGSFNSGSSFSSGVSSGGGFSSGGYSTPGQTITELNKEYYLYSAPEETVHSGANSQSSTTTLKKNLRVIFIKAPENNGAANAALQIAKQINEDQTAIYVLTKENDVSEISNQLQQISEIRSQKPEVRFVKYRTAQDALNAQRTIQAQYDALGGSTKSSNEGVAPVLNYASSAPVSNVQGSSSHHHHHQHSSSSGSASSLSGSIAAPLPQKSYLPPVVV